MKPLDRFLQRWRIVKAAPYIPAGARVLDIGCADGALFRRLRSRIREGVGIDPGVSGACGEGPYRLIAGRFPDDVPAGAPFDVITMLAVVEHIPLEQLPHVAQRCGALLTSGGRLILTVPSPLVDHLLDVLKRLHLLDGMELEEHTGFDVRQTPRFFSTGGLRLVVAKPFQLGPNHLFVFQKGPST